MIKVILGRKLAMTQIFDENILVPITIVEAGPCVIVERRVKKRNGYNAIQLGFLEAKESRVNKPESGHFRKNEISPKKYLREIRVNDIGNLNIKDEITVDVFEEGDFVDTHAVTKGKGFQGPMKRFGISKRSHKSEKSIRNPGSLGPWISYHYMGYRVPKAGQTGFHLRTELSKFILLISKEPEEVNPKGGFVNYGLVKSEFVLIKGSIPGPKKRLIRLTPSWRKTKEEAPQVSRISKKSKQ